MDVQPDIALIGATSRLGKAIISQAGMKACGFVRRPTGAEKEIVVKDYHQIGSDGLAGFATIVNCTGLRTGNDLALARANVELARHLACAAKAAGARRFIHVSSFSILGHARRIDAMTPPAPVDAYGRSKAAGEAALLGLDCPDFAVIPVRLPAIVGPGRPGDKINRLIALWHRLPFLPVSRRKVQRAMITFDLAAQVLLALASEQRGGPRLAADPRPFDFVSAASALQAAGAGRFRTLAVPAAMLAPLRYLAPGLYRSLWQDSMLDPAINVAADMPSDLYPALVAIAREGRT